MVNLLKIEWLKIRKYLAFLLISGFFFLGIFFANYMVFLFKKNVVDEVPGSQLLYSGAPYGFYKVWETTTYVSSFFLMLPALLIVILITNEYNFKTHRQNIIDGWSRFEFLKVKLALAVIFALASTLLVILVALLFGLSSGTSFSFNGIENIAYFLLKALTYNMVGILIALLTRRSGIAIAVFFVYTIVENGVSWALYGLAIWIKKEHGTDITNVGNYLPMNASDSLQSSPFDRLTSAASSMLPSNKEMVVLAFALAYLVLFYWWCKRKFLNADL